MTDATRQIIDRLSELIDDALSAFQMATGKAEGELFDGLAAMLNDLDYTAAGSIRQTAANIRRIADIRARANQILNGGAFASGLTAYADTFQKVQQLANQYFELAVGLFPTGDVLAALQEQAVSQAVATLSGAGINAGVSSQIEKLLMDNVATGASKAQLSKALRQNILSSPTTNGYLARYSETYTDTALHTYSRQYLDLAAGDLGLVWYLYVGSKKESTRPFCLKFAGKFWHRREVENMGRGLEPNGNIPLTKAELQGRIQGTNASSIFSNAGGWRCRHMYVPVAVEAVPESAINRAKASGFV